MSLPQLPLQISERKALLVFMDLLLVNAAILLALLMWTLEDPWRTLSRGFVLSQIHWFLFLPLLWLLLASVNDFYDLKVADNFLSSAFTLLRITAFMLLVYLLIYFFSPRESLPRLFILFYAVLSFILLALWRSGYALLFSRLPFQRRAIIVGAGAAGQTIAQTIRENLGPDYELVGYIDDDPAKQDQVIAGLPVVGTRRHLVSLVKTQNVSEVILAVTYNVHPELFRALIDCQEQGVQITPMPLLYEELTGKVPVEHIGDNWPVALPLDHPSTRGFFPLFKRIMDLSITAIGLTVFVILLPLVALALYIDSPGPIFYTQERVGKGRKTFRLIKFRSMIPNAEKAGEAVWAKKGDTRITHVGRFLRLTRLDELPQFINVLKGEMSIVGPRPERPEFVAELEERIPFYRVRHSVKPGMAGWGLVRYGYADSIEDALEKVQYDLYYIKRQSIYLDLLILAKTIGAMITFKGR
ncbi:MAG: sugar transferase [Chloroflexi bacterium]|nr:sugar transferase [Chloroflexota bacterium]